MIDRLPSKPHSEPDNPEQEKLLRKPGTGLPESVTAKPQPAGPDKRVDGTRPRGKR
ncbi:hypothetical protein STAQ_24790 [Allostella sp. ATCC 35155]|nr:hypothetical protein STAQ_24790 [Stella sp. ATCC 35155]